MNSFFQEPEAYDKINIILFNGTLFEGYVKYWNYIDKNNMVWCIVGPNKNNVEKTDNFIQKKYIMAYEIAETDTLKQNVKPSGSLWNTPADSTIKVLGDFDFKDIEINKLKEIIQQFKEKFKIIENSSREEDGHTIYKKGLNSQQEEDSKFPHPIYRQELKNDLDEFVSIPKRVSAENDLIIEEPELDQNLRTKKLSDLRILQSKAKKQEIQQHLKRRDLGGISEVKYELPNFVKKHSGK